MTWLDRITVQESCETTPVSENMDERMSPGLTGKYDWQVREKASVHTPPPPPECMGLEGEYDPMGLVKRVAVAFDQDPLIGEILTLQVVQVGRAIAFKGEIHDPALLQRMVEVASQVDGTTIVDTQGVITHHPS